MNICLFLKTPLKLLKTPLKLMILFFHVVLNYKNFKIA
jgi:hypothetical protein